MAVTQDALRRAILDPAMPAPEGLTDAAGRPAGKRFDVYRNNVVVGLTEALATGFPVLRKLVGEANFRVLAGAFVRAHPPESPVLMLYGARLPHFLESFPPARALPYLPDVARLEYALRESYHAADAEALDPALLATVPPDRLPLLRFRLAPALRLVRSDWPVVAIWRFNAEDGPSPAMQAESALVLRPDYDPVIEPLDPAGAAFVAALMAGQPLGTAQEAGAALSPGFDPTPALAALLRGGALIQIQDTDA